MKHAMHTYIVQWTEREPLVSDIEDPEEGTIANYATRVDVEGGVEDDEEDAPPPMDEFYELELRRYGWPDYQQNKTMQAVTAEQVARFLVWQRAEAGHIVLFVKVSEQ